MTGAPTSGPSAASRTNEVAEEPRARCTLWPTRLGGKALGFYAILLATFFAIPYSNLFFLGIAFLSVIATGNALWALGNLRGLTATVAELPPCAAGRPITVRFTIASRRARPAFLLSGTLTAGDATCRTAAADVTGDGGTLLGELPPLARGVYPIARAGIESPYPHGLLRATRPATMPAELIVFPAPVALSPERRTVRAMVADLAASPCDGAHGSAGLRDWRTGDDPRRVHWKASARRGQLVVRDPEDDDVSGIKIVLDRRCPASALETALSVVTTLALIVEERKERLTLHTQGAAASYGTGAVAMIHLWRLLAVLQPLPPDAAPPPGAVPTALRLPVSGGAR